MKCSFHAQVPGNILRLCIGHFQIYIQFYFVTSSAVTNVYTIGVK